MRRTAAQSSSLAGRWGRVYPHLPSIAGSPTLEGRWHVVKKLALLSIIIASIVIPVRAARLKNPRIGYRRMITQMLLFNIFYVFVLVVLWGRM